MKSPDDALRLSKAFIDERFNLNSDANLLIDGFSSMESLLFSEGQARTLQSRRKEIEELLASEARELLIRHMADGMERRLVELSQYVNLTTAERQGLAAVYERLADGILAILRQDLVWEDHYRAMQSAILEHFRNLQSFLRRFTDRDALLSDGRKILRFPCYEYSVHFQLEILSLPPAPSEPILDLGCGRDALLVSYLTCRGLDAWGIDRHVPEDAPRLQRADWLEVPLEPGRWGTIVSHMAFSNHFINHMARNNGRPERYARRYAEILRALRPGGSFYYAPGLPFLECFLPQEEFPVERRPIEPEVPPAGDLGPLREGLRYAAKVTRVK